MSEHTPGPWTWWTSNSWRRLRHDNRGKSIDVLMPFVCHHDGQPDIQVSSADMALIAAAPDLLEALTDLLVACTCEVNEKGGGGFILARMTDARAAIKKAGGTFPLTPPKRSEGSNG